MSEALERSGATVMQATPAMWRLLLEGGWGGLAGLRMLCGGEALTGELARELIPRGGELCAGPVRWGWGSAVPDGGPGEVPG